MRNTGLDFIVVTAVCFIFVPRAAFGSLSSPAAVTMDVTPQYSDDVIPNTINFRCGLSGGRNCGMTIVSIQLSKDDHKLMARLVGKDTIKYGRLLQSSLKAEGRIEKDASESFLSMTIDDAVSEDSGHYTCKIVYWDESDNIAELSITRNITFTSQDTQDIVRHLMAKVSFMENMMNFREDQYRRNFSSQEAKLQAMQHKIDQSETNQDLKSAVRYLVDEMYKMKTVHRDQMDQIKTDHKDQLDQMKTDHRDQLDQMKTDHRDQLEEQRNQSMTEIRLLTRQLDDQNQQINQLQNKAATNVMFTAWRDKRDGLQTGKVINFGKVLVNEGGGYDGTTGIFTAPVAGYYLFHFSSATARFLFVDLKSGSGEILSRIYAGNGNINFADYATGSSVVKLKARDTVMPVAQRMDRATVLFFEWGQYFMNRFDGYLLKTF